MFNNSVNSATITFSWNGIEVEIPLELQFTMECIVDLLRVAEELISTLPTDTKSKYTYVKDLVIKRLKQHNANQLSFSETG